MAASAVVPGGENCNDCKQVVGEFGWSSISWVDLWSVQHCNHGSVACEDVLDKVESKTRKPVPVGNHNLAESACEREVQYLEQAAALEIEARPDV